MSKKKKILLISSLVFLLLVSSLFIYLKFFKKEKPILTEKEKRIMQLLNFKKPEGEGIKTTEEIEKEMDMITQEYLKNKEKNNK